MADKLILFVSSSMTELRPEREAVKSVLEADHRIDAWVYEDDMEARDRTTQDTYLRELDRAHGYVGIFWKKYGEYTIDEFEHARGKHRMVFVKKVADESERDPQLRAFLERISHPERGEVSPRWFTDASDLPGAVQGAVHQWFVETLTREYQQGLPPLLVDRCDRYPQQIDITDAAQTESSVGDREGHAAEPRHVVCILTGHEEERHRWFVRVVAKRVIPEALDPESTSVKDKSVDWPEGRSYEDFRKAMLFSLSRHFSTQRTYDPEAIASEMDRHPGPVMVNTHVHFADIQRDPVRAIGWYLRFWDEWPIRHGSLLFAFLCIDYADRPRGGLRRLFSRGEPSEVIAQAVASLRPGPEPRRTWTRIGLYTPEELGAVPLGVAQEWAALPEVTSFLGSGERSLRAQDRIAGEYKDLERAKQLLGGRARMGTLAPKLESILKDIRRREG